MGKPESAMRGALLRGLRKAPYRFHALAVDNESCDPGTADTNYAGWFNSTLLEGWCELKQIARWPRDPDEVVRVNLFTLQQRVWLRKRAASGGRVHLLLRVGNPRRADYMLFRGDVAAEHVGRASFRKLDEISCYFWNGPMSAANFLTGVSR